MSFKVNPLYRSDGYKPGHKAMLAPKTTRLYGTWIPRSIKYAPPGVKKIVSFGQQFDWRWINDEFVENFFNKSWAESSMFVQDMNGYLGLPYDGQHFRELHELGYLPLRVKALPEGIETNPNIPHQTFVNTVDGFAWLPLYIETILSSLAWKPATSATIALRYRRNVEEWVKKTDPDNAWLIPYLCHDFAGRGLDPHSMLSSGLGHGISFRGSDELIVIPGARYFYNEPEDEVCINSVNASEHSVSTTKIFTVGERQMIIDWLKLLPDGIFSQVADTFSLWQFIDYLKDPEIKELVLNRNGKLVVRPDSGDPVKIVTGYQVDYFSDAWSGSECVNYEGRYYLVEITNENRQGWKLGKEISEVEVKGVIQLLWDIYGGTVNEQGFKVLDPHIGAIYGDSINLERQVAIYDRLASKGFAATNIVLGIGSFTYQFNTRDTFGFAAKGAWFECDGVEYSIYKDPITDDGTKKSLKGLQMVWNNNPNCNGGEILFDGHDDFQVKGECSWEEEQGGLLQVIFEDGKFYNQTTLTEVRKRVDLLV